MRIAHIIWGLGTGGAETMLVDIVNIQVKTETVALAAVNDIVDDLLLQKIDNRCTVKLLRRKIGSRSPIPWIKLNLFLYSFCPDIIHFHLEGMRKMVFHPAPKVFTIHNAYSSNKEYPRYQALYAISDGVKDYTKQQGFDAITIWNGIDTSKIKTKNKISLNRNRVFNLVCVGRLRFIHKGQDILVKALKLLQENNLTNFQLDFIGDGESRNDLIKMIFDYGLQDYITLLGQRGRDYVYEHLCDYDLFVLPSRSEGFGLSVAEAMCAKVPVLISDLEGPMGVIDKGRLGLSFIPEDSNDLAQKIKSFIENGFPNEKVEEAYQFAVKHFDISCTANQYISEYRKVLK